MHQDFSCIYTSICSFFGRGFPWLYSTDIPTRPLGYSVHAGPASAHGQHQSCAEGLLFILYLLIITRLPSADRQSFIPHILTRASRVFVALAAALRNFCLIPSRLSWASHVLFAQMSFTLYLTNLTFFITNYSNHPLTGICEQSVASPVRCLMAVKSGGPLLRWLVLLSHSAARDARLLPLDTASVQRDHALNMLPPPGEQQ